MFQPAKMPLTASLAAAAQPSPCADQVQAITLHYLRVAREMGLADEVGLGLGL